VDSHGKQSLKINDMEFKTGAFKMGRCNIIITIETGDWHLSISTPSESPTYEEIKKARYKYLPDNLVMAQIFPPKADFVNLHPYCHHLWEIGEYESEQKLKEDG